MAFGLTPAGAGFPPQAPDAFPNYIQFQYEGTDLGGPTVDTVDFQGSVFVSRGDGENANKVTVVVGGSPSAPAAAALDILAFKLVGSGSGNGITTWAQTVLRADSDVGSYNAATNELTFAAEGVYQVTVATRATVGIAGPVNQVILRSPVGGVDEWTDGSRHYVDNGGGRDQFDMVDVFVLNMQAGDLVRGFEVLTDNSEESLSAALAVSVIKLPA